jgi:DNA-binding NtrC family response regulator
MATAWQFSSVPGFPSFGGPKWVPAFANLPAGERERLEDRRKLRILVIDDEQLIAETVEEILKHEGFDARAVFTSAAALVLAEEWQPDIVLSDVIMPGLNGIEMGIRIRELAPGCRVILFSGQAATVDLLEKARSQGHRFEILAKPIKPEKLVSVIRERS